MSLVRGRNVSDIWFLNKIKIQELKLYELSKRKILYIYIYYVKKIMKKGVYFLMLASLVIATGCGDKGAVESKDSIKKDSSIVDSLKKDSVVVDSVKKDSIKK